MSSSSSSSSLYLLVAAIEYQRAINAIQYFGHQLSLQKECNAIVHDLKSGRIDLICAINRTITLVTPHLRRNAARWQDYSVVGIISTLLQDLINEGSLRSAESVENLQLQLLNGDVDEQTAFAQLDHFI